MSLSILHTVTKNLSELFFMSGDTVKIKINENSLPLPITHVDDFVDYFPDVNLLTFSR